MISSFLLMSKDTNQKNETSLCGFGLLRMMTGLPACRTGEHYPETADFNLRRARMAVSRVTEWVQGPSLRFVALRTIRLKSPVFQTGVRGFESPGGYHFLMKTLILKFKFSILFGLLLLFIGVAFLLA